MDQLDIHILRELLQPQPVFPIRPGLDPSYRTMAKVLGVSEGTVRDRVSKMRSSGLVSGSKVFLHPGLLGLQTEMYSAEISPSLEKEEVVAKLRLVEGVVIVENHHGSFMGVNFLFEDEGSLHRKLQLVRSIAGAKEEIFTRVPFPSCKMPLKLTDWEIIHRLVKGTPASPEQIAGEVGISLRTLKRRVDRLVRGGALYTFPTVDIQRMDGGVQVDALVTYDGSGRKLESEQGIMKLLDEYLFYAGLFDTAGLYSMVLPSPSSATKLAARIRQVPGVRTARLELVDEHIDQMEAIGDYVQRHLKTLRALGDGRGTK